MTPQEIAHRLRTIAKDVKEVAEDDRETAWCYDYAADLEALAKEVLK